LHLRGRTVVAFVAAAWLALVAAPASAGTVSKHDEHVRRAVGLMASLAKESRANAARIRTLYAPKVEDLSFENRRHLAAALDEGHVVPLPTRGVDNVRPRLSGAHPIGEADLASQHLYVGARPEALGLLLHIAARVPDADLEVTSLVRHRAYQRSLARRNANARASVPTHTMGLAFDISILNVPLSVARQIRDVMKRMSADGDLLYIAERRQLVFHVVPAPRRRAFYAAVFETLTSVPRVELPEPSWPVPGAAVPPIDPAMPVGPIVVVIFIAFAAAILGGPRIMRLMLSTSSAAVQPR
jgi:hypothetical protein